MIRSLIVAFMLLAPASAFAQAIVIATCGSLAAPLPVGSLHYIYMNQNGYLCVSSTTLLRVEQMPPELSQPSDTTVK